MKTTKAFTLIELLVVIGLIAVLAGGIGLSLGGGDKSNSLKSAQNILSSLLSGARGQAALSQVESAIVINVATSSDYFLRELRLVKRDASLTNWVIVGPPVYLDKGIYVVPSSSPGSISSNIAYENSSDWADLHSTCFGTVDIKPLYLEETATTELSQDNYRLLVKFSPLGSPSVDAGGTANGRQIVMSPADLTGPNALKFANPENVRGVTISAYGVTTLINESEAFHAK